MKQLKAVKYAYSVFSCVLMVFGLTAMLGAPVPERRFMLIGGILMIIFGALRILGYCSE